MEFPSHKTYTVDEATRRLMNFCSYRERSHKEVEEKLKEMRMIPEACEKIIMFLIQENFLNEERYAQSFARGKFRIKKWGRVRIERELKQNGVSKFNINTALKEIDENQYYAAFNELANQKLEKITEPHILKKKKKLYDYLYSKGYESQLIYDFLNKLG